MRLANQKAISQSHACTRFAKSTAHARTTWALAYALYSACVHMQVWRHEVVNDLNQSEKPDERKNTS